MADRVDIAVVTKTYSGLEGNRVKAGTRFAVGREQGGLPVITKTRYETLRQNRLVRPFGDQDTKEAARYARPLARRVTEPQAQGAPSLAAQKVRQATRSRLRQSEAPAAPTQLKGPQRGSQTGGETSRSSSPAAPASKTSTSPSSSAKKTGGRGTRGAAPSSASSPSTTPIR